MHRNWCGNPCSICKNPCALDGRMPCSLDCENLSEDGQLNGLACVNCDSNYMKVYDWEIVIKNDVCVFIKEFTTIDNEQVAVEVISDYVAMYYHPDTKKILNLDEYKAKRFSKEFNPCNDIPLTYLDESGEIFEMDQLYDYFSSEQYWDIYLAIVHHKEMMALKEIDITPDAIYLRDVFGEIASWIDNEWYEDPDIIPSIANAIKAMYEKGPSFVRNELKPKIKTFQIPVVCQKWGIMRIEANSLAEAEDIALTSATLPSMDYIDDSLRLDKDSPIYGEVI